MSIKLRPAADNLGAPVHCSVISELFRVHYAEQFRDFNASLGFGNTQIFKHFQGSCP